MKLFSIFFRLLRSYSYNQKIVLVKTDDIFTPEAVAALRQLASRMRKIKGVARLYSIDDVPVISGGIPHRVLPADASASLTTAFGFGSLLLASRPSVRDFGGCCAAGCVLTFVAVMSFVPLLSGTFLGRRCAAVAKSEQANSWNYLFDWVEGCVSARPTLITLLGVVLTTGLAATALKLKPDVDIQFYSPRSDSMRALDIFAEDFGGGGTIHTWVDWQDPNEVPASLGDARLAVQRSFRAVGKALVVTTIIFMFCFGTCMTSTIPTTRNFAHLPCIGFAAAPAGDLLILPALLLVGFSGRTRKHEPEVPAPA